MVCIGWRRLSVRASRSTVRPAAVQGEGQYSKGYESEPDPGSSMRSALGRAAPASRRGTIRGILFDKDGTLLDFDATWLPAYRRGARAVAALAGTVGAESLLAAGGFDAATSQCMPRSALAAGTNREIAAVWARACGLDVEAVERTIEREFLDAAGCDAAPVTNLGAFFADLAARDLVLGVATMDDEAAARAVLDRLGVSRHLAFLCGGDSGWGTKPGPGMVDAFLAATGLRAREVMVVGDTPHDMEMARAAGVACRVAVLSGAGSRAVLEPLADHVVTSIEVLDDVLNLLTDPSVEDRPV